jgi:hypothetical protein
MAYPNVGSMSLQPTRPAPAAPQRRATDNALASVGYNINLQPVGAGGGQFGAPAGNGYSGIGGSPGRNFDGGPPSASVVRQGNVSVKEEGFASFLWRPKWLVLKETTLTLHKSEVGSFIIRI